MNPYPANGIAKDLFSSLQYREARNNALHMVPPRLTEREMQVVAMLHASCDTNKEIAYQLGLTKDTIRELFVRIRDRLIYHFGHRPSRNELVLWWERLSHGPYVPPTDLTGNS